MFQIALVAPPRHGSLEFFLGASSAESQRCQYESEASKRGFLLGESAGGRAVFESESVYWKCSEEWEGYQRAPWQRLSR